MPNEWQSVLDELKSNLTEMAFSSYFGHFNFESCEDGILTVSVPNVFVQTQIETKYNEAVMKALHNNFEFSELRIILSGSKGVNTVRRGAGAVEILPNENIGSNFQTAGEAIAKGTFSGFKVSNTTNLNPKFTLDNYIIGSNNDVAVSAAQSILDNPGTRFNPYFLYGGPGLGKTHLIQAIGNEYVKRYPDMKVLYVTIEQFYHDFVEAMRKKIDGFADKYRSVDVLIVDDFQYIVNKEKSQEEFFHTFNYLTQHNKQVIVSSDRLPSQIATVDERLSSRLMQGVPIDIQMPDFETRCAIIKLKAEISGWEIEDSAVEYIANSVRTNIRELEGALNTVLAMAELRGLTPSAIINEGYAGDSISSKTSRQASSKQVVDRVAKYYNLTLKDLMGKSRVKHINHARHVAWYLMSTELNMSSNKIGTEFSKDHSTILSGIKVIDELIKNDYKTRQQITELREKIYAS